MLYFLSKCWRGTKLTVASTQTIASGGVLLHGLLASGGAISIALGAVGLACSALLLIDSKGQYDIARFVRRNEAALNEYRKQNSEFQRENGELHSNVEKLHASLAKSADEVRSLQRVRIDYVATLAEFEQNLSAEQQENKHLAEQVQKLDELRERFDSENNRLQSTLADAQQHNAQLQTLYEQAQKADATHRAQADRLKKIVDSMQELLAAVAHEGDEFQQFSDAIDTRLLEMDKQNESLENTAAMMERLLERLKHEKFENLDANADGVVTADEFEQAVRNDAFDTQL